VREAEGFEWATVSGRGFDARARLIAGHVHRGTRARGEPGGQPNERRADGDVHVCRIQPNDADAGGESVLGRLREVCEDLTLFAVRRLSVAARVEAPPLDLLWFRSAR
jgi:hypothetical protein